VDWNTVFEPGPIPSLEIQVIQAAEAALADHGWAGAIDVFTGMGLLASTNLKACGQGRVRILEELI
jgi:hypothetical protein